VSFNFENTNPNFKRKDAVNTKHALTPEINKIPELIKSEIEKKYGKIEKIEIKSKELKVTFDREEDTTTSEPTSEISTPEEGREETLRKLRETIENAKKRLAEIDIDLAEIRAKKIDEQLIPEISEDQNEMIDKKEKVIKYIKQELAIVRRNFNNKKIKSYEEDLSEIENGENGEDIINKYWENLKKFQK
jgi:hypothetical protein